MLREVPERGTMDSRVPRSVMSSRGEEEKNVIPRYLSIRVGRRRRTWPEESHHGNNCTPSVQEENSRGTVQTQTVVWIIYSEGNL